ncbi:hypothetical protein AD936_22145 [Gluconobacter japonicus]|nr:hypothetical protein AD936_22145 [Gluconobacter japonicus]
MLVSFREEFHEAFPASADAGLFRCVSQALVMASELMEHESFLNSLIGNDIRGHIRRAAVLFNVHSACKAGDLPFFAEMGKMPLGGGHWVELTSGNFRAHIYRTDGPEIFPADTPTKQNSRLSNQFNLSFDDDSKVISIPSLRKTYEAWLTFGANGRELSHLCWGMPEAKRNTWLDRINIIRRLGTAPAEQEAKPTNAVRLRFKEHIEEALRSGDTEVNRSS